ncbi:protein phosphatase 2C domain-containing protein [Dorea sp. NSJ-36]|uniref:Protein phosphatase 2C domain-containing protein n=1 Tax=Dorea hominis TaxID=2763040 RepID=A0ABR7EY69_9FIRM|nr:PP2C family serine/threonine-protein phosphatase [Dorea hominis]MBC5666294.1 protein phosphatase 2C domain-containing protein [Dorea hominis]
MKCYVCDGIVRGATHVRNAKPCQDNKKIVKISDEIIIVAVADGHGSSKCPRSDRGSLIAVNTFCDVMKNYLQSYEADKEGMENLITFLNREGEMRFAQDICEEWQARVKQSFYKDKAEDLIDEENNIKWPAVFSLYGTTLLGMLITNRFVFSFQIGDGDISLVSKKEVAPLVQPEKFLGTETHSLSKMDAWRKAVTAVRRRDGESRPPYMYMLSTDGFANSYTSDAEYQKTCRDYLDMLEEHGVKTVQSNLKNWLAETSELGCGDDITVVMVYFAEE